MPAVAAGLVKRQEFSVFVGAAVAAVEVAAVGAQGCMAVSAFCDI